MLRVDLADVLLHVEVINNQFFLLIKSVTLVQKAAIQINTYSIGCPHRTKARTAIRIQKNQNRNIFPK